MDRNFAKKSGRFKPYNGPKLYENIWPFQTLQWTENLRKIWPFQTLQWTEILRKIWPFQTLQWSIWTENLRNNLAVSNLIMDRKSGRFKPYNGPKFCKEIWPFQNLAIDRNCTKTSSRLKPYN